MVGRRIVDKSNILILAVLAATSLLWLSEGPISAGSLPQPSGDANCDSTVNSIDAAIVLQFDAALIDRVPCPLEADVSFDGMVNALDASIILQHEAALLAHCPDAHDGQGLVTKLVLGSNQTSFFRGQAISMTLSIINCGDEPVTRTYGSSQLYDFVVRDTDSHEVWWWSHDMLFLAVITNRSFQPGQLVTYGAVWNQERNDGEEVAPGRYEILGYDAVCRRDMLDRCDLIDSVMIEIGP